MLGSHLIYHKSRKEARDKIDSEKVSAVTARMRLADDPLVF